MTKGNFGFTLMVLIALLFIGSMNAYSASQPPCPASDNLDYVYDANNQTCSVGNYKYAIQLKPGGVAIVGVPGGNGNWTCSRIRNAGSDTFFIPGGGANDGTSAGNNAKTDFLTYCTVDDSNLSGNLQKNLLLNCDKNVTCDLCAQDLQGNELLSNTPIDSSILSYGIGSLCTQPSNSFSIPVVKNGFWTWSCSTAAGLTTTSCKAPVAPVPPGKWILSSAGTCTPTCSSGCSAPDTYVCDHTAPNGAGSCTGSPPSTSTTYPQLSGSSCVQPGIWVLGPKCTVACDTGCYTNYICNQSTAPNTGACTSPAPSPVYTDPSTVSACDPGQPKNCKVNYHNDLQCTATHCGWQCVQ